MDLNTDPVGKPTRTKECRKTEEMCEVFESTPGSLWSRIAGDRRN